MKTKDFVTAFRPQDGDLIYGRAEARGAYYGHFTQAQRDACDDAGAWVTIDEYNDYFGTSGDAIAAGPTVADVRKFVKDQSALASVEPTLNKGYDVGWQQLDQREKYQEKIVNSRYSPTSVLHPVRGSPQKLASEGFVAGVGKAATADDAEYYNKTYRSIRRACKFGIGIVALEAAFRTPRAKIRFVLDGLDMQAIASKQTRQGYDRIAVPITSSELRYVCRNWGKLERIVKFYVNLAAVNPPWVEDWDLPSIPAPGIPQRTLARKPAWDAYAAARGVKYPAGPPVKGLV
jgi:hypothetical protein